MYGMTIFLFQGGGKYVENITTFSYSHDFLKKIEVIIKILYKKDTNIITESTIHCNTYILEQDIISIHESIF